VILLGSDYWRGLIDWIRDTMAAQGTISSGDLELVTITDDVGEAVKVIQGTEAARARGDNGGGMRAVPVDNRPVEG
jgi:predicted Rossmann-fold nucleotide-binding protein